MKKIRNQMETIVVIIIMTITQMFLGLNEVTVFASAEQTQEYQLGENVTGVLTSDGILTVSGKGEMFSFDAYSEDNQSPLQSEKDRIEKIIIEDGVTNIGDYAFAKLYSLQEVDVAGSVKSIGRDAFLYCQDLKRVYLAEGIERLGYFCFGRCSELQTINFPKGLKAIEMEAFYGCFALENVVFPDGLESIGSGAFGGCIKINELNIPASVTNIAATDFGGTNSLFGACANIMEDREYTIHDINVDEENQVYKSIDGVLFSKDGKQLLIYPDGRREKEYAVPEGVEVIGSYAFQNSYIENIKLPDGLVTLKNGAFAGAYQLSEINLPETLLTIEHNAFEACWKIDNIEIPKSVTYIGYSAFSKCLSLKNITIYNTVEDIGHATINNGAISDYIFLRCPDDLVVYLYKGSAIDEYMDLYTQGNREYMSVIDCESILFENDTLEMSVGEVQYITAKVFPENATYQRVIYTSSDSNVVVVGNFITGALRAVGKGTAAITATSEDGKATAVMTVTVKDEESADSNMGSGIAGDLNRDGSVDLQDVQLALQAYLELISLTQGQEKAADMNGDGSVDLQDVQQILQIYLFG